MTDPVVQLHTERLLMRGFVPGDLAPFSEMNADPAVMEHFVRPMTRQDTEAFVDRIMGHWQEVGWGLWALERKDSGEFIGYTGLWPVRFESDFEPKVEIGWRLSAAHWGQGFATEAARAALRFAFDTLGWGEVTSFTNVDNRRSRAVMERIGMLRYPSGDFDHPAVPEGHPVRPHVLYRISSAELHDAT